MKVVMKFPNGEYLRRSPVGRPKTAADLDLAHVFATAAIAKACLTNMTKAARRGGEGVPEGATLVGVRLTEVPAP